MIYEWVFFLDGKLHRFFVTGTNHRDIAYDIMRHMRKKVLGGG